MNHSLSISNSEIKAFDTYPFSYENSEKKAVRPLYIASQIQTKEQFYAENPDLIDKNSRVVSISVYGDGELIPPTEYALREGETALELVLRVAKYNGLRADSSGGYVRGIGGLYEFDKGADSGWKIKINGEFPSVGADMIFLNDGDRVEWIYRNW